MSFSQHVAWHWAQEACVIALGRKTLYGHHDER